MEMKMTDTEPTFRVETEQDRKILVPQFQPGDLSDEQREVYDGLREAGPGHHAGAIAVTKIAAAQFKAGETVTLEETVRRYTFGASEAAEALRAFQADLEAALAPVANDLAEACQPLVEWRQDVAEAWPRTPTAANNNHARHYHRDRKTVHDGGNGRAENCRRPHHRRGAGRRRRARGVRRRRASGDDGDAHREYQDNRS